MLTDQHTGWNQSCLCDRKAPCWDRSLADHDVTLDSNQVYFTLLLTFYARMSRSFVSTAHSLHAEAMVSVVLEPMLRVCALGKDVCVSRGNTVKHFLLHCNVQLKRLKETDLLCLKESPDVTEAGSLLIDIYEGCYLTWVWVLETYCLFCKSRRGRKVNLVSSSIQIAGVYLCFKVIALIKLPFFPMTCWLMTSYHFLMKWQFTNSFLNEMPSVLQHLDIID